MLKGTGKLLIHSLSEFIDNKVFKLSAALAYYTIFSIPGLLIVIIWVAGIFYGETLVEDTVYGQLANFIGKDTAVQIREALRSSVYSTDSGWTTTLGLITLIFGATGVFGEIQDSINHIWHLKAKPRKGRGLFLIIIINRLLSFSMIIVLAFLMLVSLMVHGILQVVLDKMSGGTMEAVMIYVLNLVISFLFTVLLFAAIFKVLPDARIKWRHIMVGAVTTAILFMVGKYLITYYLGKSAVTTTYGATGSFIIILLWVYYSALILYLGAIFTRAFAIHRGSHIYPNKYAVWVEQKEIESMQPLERKQWADDPTKKTRPSKP
jgi:membrane protein